MSRPVIFWGATGQARVLREAIDGTDLELVALFDNNPAVVSPFVDVPLFIGTSGFESWHATAPAATGAVVAIAGARGRDRLSVQRWLESQALEPLTVVHRTAFVARNATIGKGSQVLAHAKVCVDAVLGEACILNTGASVDHECVLGDGVHVSAGAVLAGLVRVGDCSLIAVGATVLPRITIGRDVVVGAGAVVTRDVPDGVIVVGSPARVLRKNDDAP
ncbi:MAG: NeuD/PglB/VioB family sugar acetyltransferase [Thermoanaerobaculia bacterium]